jgi:hypothetical protein
MIISDRLRRWFLRYNFRFGGSLSIAKIVSQAEPLGRKAAAYGSFDDVMHDAPSRWTISSAPAI